MFTIYHSDSEIKLAEYVLAQSVAFSTRNPKVLIFVGIGRLQSGIFRGLLMTLERMRLYTEHIKEPEG